MRIVSTVVSNSRQRALSGHGAHLPVAGRWKKCGRQREHAVLSIFEVSPASASHKVHTTALALLISPRAHGEHAGAFTPLKLPALHGAQTGDAGAAKLPA